MKASGQHRYNCLNNSRIASIKMPGRHLDGGGLYLLVEPSGSKRWVLRIVASGKRRDIGLGSVESVSLGEARETAAQLRKIAKMGGDPLAERKKSKQIIPTFETAARLVHSQHLVSFRNDKHRGQWIRTLETYVFPTLGSRRIDHIETPDVLAVLSPIWLNKPETARRIKQRLHTVFDWAKSAGHRQGENPVSAVVRGLPRQIDTKRHHAAMPFFEIPAFLKRMQRSDATEIAKFALEFLILTASRTNEVLEMNWDEVDFPNRVWIVPSARMKAGREHRIPLSKRAMTILEQTHALSLSEILVFPGRTKTVGFSNMALLMMLRRLDMPYTVHGFRSSFRDWAAERTNFPNEVCEMALAHSVQNKVEAAYRRGDLFEKRRKLMDAWAQFIFPDSQAVVYLRTG